MPMRGESDLRRAHKLRSNTTNRQASPAILAVLEYHRNSLTAQRDVLASPQIWHRLPTVLRAPCFYIGDPTASIFLNQ